MTDSLLVLVEDAVAGTLHRLKGGRLRFDYAGEYRATPGATPLSLSMPLAVRTHTERTITPWLWGLLPDNDAVLVRWARHFQVSRATPFSLLATPIGEDCAGAVRFVDPETQSAVPTRPGAVTWLSEDEVALRLKDLREDSTSWLGRSFTGRFSLAGTQAKTALLVEGGRWGVPSGNHATTHIVKPAVAGLDDHNLNEHLCLDAARRVGLVAVRTKVHQFTGESAVVVERYDRRLSGDAIIRVHQEDLCQALAQAPSLKYQNEGGPAPRDVVGLLRRAMAPRVAENAVSRFADALIWNWLIAGTDAHAKNYSLLLAGDQVRLAPLYDIASALPYGTDERKLRLAMTIGGDYRVATDYDRWPEAARELGLDAGTLVARVRELADAAPDAFADAARTDDVAALGKPVTTRLVDLVAARCERCRRLVA